MSPQTATSSDAKIRLLGRVLAAGAVAEDEAKVDSEEQLLRIALELDPVDLRALRALERWQSRDAAATVAFSLDLDPEIANPIVARLERLHLISVERQASIYDTQNPDDDSVDIHEEWGTTSTTAAVLDVLRSRADPLDPDVVRRDGAPWSGFTEAQSQQLERLAHLSQHDWPHAVDPDQPVALALRRLDALGVPYLHVRAALRSVGCSRPELEQLDRWADETG